MHSAAGGRWRWRWRERERERLCFLTWKLPILLFSCSRHGFITHRRIIILPSSLPSARTDDLPYFSEASDMASHIASGMFSPPPDHERFLTFSSSAHSIYPTWDGEAEEEGLHDPDPALQYINDILMEEDLEDQKCMMQECSAYQAMAKGFYEVLGEDGCEVNVTVSNQELDQNWDDVSGTQADEDWINQVLNLEAEAATSSEVSAETSLVGTSAANATSLLTWSVLAAPPFVAASQSDEQTRYSYISSSNSSSFSKSDGLPLPSSNHAISSHHSSETVSCLPLISRVKVEETLEDTTFQSPFYSIAPAGNSNFAYEDDLQNLGAFEQVISGGNGASSLQTDEKPAVFGMTIWDKFQESVNASRKRVELSILSDEGTPEENGYDNRSIELLKGTSRTPAMAFPSFSIGGGETLSFVQNRDLKAECSAKWLREGPLPKCSETKIFTGRKQESAVGAGNNGLSALRAQKSMMVDLRSLLVSCAQAVGADDLRKANVLIQDIRQHACPNGSATQRMAHYFMEALVARLSGTGPQLFTVMSNNRPSASQMLKALHVYMANCPFKKISHYFTNYNILKAAEGASRLHIVDYGILYGFQWPCLISALAERSGGPPYLRITGIDFPQPGYKPAERIEETGRRLAEYARTYGVPFKFQAVASKWENVNPASLNILKDEVLVVTCMHRLRHLMDETVVTVSPRRTVLANIRSMNPKIFVEAIVNAGLNAPFFISRFRETLFYFSSRFDYLDTTIENDSPERLMIEREMLGREILNIVACEGLERVERPETYRQWQSRMQQAGFGLLPLDQSMVAKAQAIVKTLYHKDFGVDDDGKWILLGWKGRILHALSTWRPLTEKR